jgi:transcriptional regulator with XRE-family HTH domain
MTKHADSDSFGGLARAQLKQRGWTQQQLAERLGVKQSVVSCYLTGKTQPTFEMIMRWAWVLGCSPHELVPAHVPALYRGAEAAKERSDTLSHSSPHLSSDSVEI